MKRKTQLSEFKKFQGEERLENLNRAWQYLTPAQRAWIYLRVRWHSSPTLHQMIEHVKYNYERWLVCRLYPAHWVK